MNQRKLQRARRVRAKISGSPERPRLSVFRSNRDFYAQLIDDGKGRTVVSASLRDAGKENSKKTKLEQAQLVGEALAKKALKLGITRAVLDRGSYQYHGRVKAFAESARKHGLKI
jgi:large subunit ribosomal protein L18